MKTKNEVQDLRDQWLDKCKEYSEKVNALKDLADRLNGGYDDELENANEELERVYGEVKQSLEEYHDACKEYLNDVLKKVDSKRRGWLRGVFKRDCFNTNDWSNAIDHLDDLSMICKHFS